MTELKQQLQELQKRFSKAWQVLNIKDKQEKVTELQAQMTRPDFWQDQEKAKKISQRAADLETQISNWQKFKKDLQDTQDVLAMDIEDEKVNLSDELNEKLKKLEKQFVNLEIELLFTKKYDNQPALVTIYAGSGGTDAQDWAEMLLRMYLRFCEKQGWKTFISSVSTGQEAGIKSVQFEVDGSYAYGYLKAEKGVHRLVRISPFDAEKMRHTSFAMVEVMPLLEDEINIEIPVSDLRIDTFKAGGHGGQSVNTTDSAVRITHLPTGLTASCQNERSQMQNKERAIKIIQSKLQQYYETELEEERKIIKGEYTEAAWGNQARSYVLHPYKMVKDHRTDFETDQVNDVLDGDIIEFIEAYLRKNK